MISIRFLRRAPASGPASPTVGAGVSIVAPVTTSRADTYPGSCSTHLHGGEQLDLALRAGGLEAHRAVLGLELTHQPGIDEQIDMADDLRQGEEGLGHGDVAPHRLRQLVRGP